jgi:hypothetical protein
MKRLLLFVVAFAYALIGVELAGLVVGKAFDFSVPSNGLPLALITTLPLRLIKHRREDLEVIRVRVVDYPLQAVMGSVWLMGILLGLLCELAVSAFAERNLGFDVVAHGYAVRFWTNVAIYALLFGPVALFGHKILPNRSDSDRYSPYNRLSLEG